MQRTPPILVDKPAFSGSCPFVSVFEQNAVDLQSPVTATCYMGHTACTVALAAAVCGKDDVSVYAVRFVYSADPLTKVVYPLFCAYKFHL